MAPLERDSKNAPVVQLVKPKILSHLELVARTVSMEEAAQQQGEAVL